MKILRFNLIHSFRWFILLTSLIVVISLSILNIFAIIPVDVFETMFNNPEVPVLRKKDAFVLSPYSKIFEDLGIKPSTDVIPPDTYDILGKIRDNENNYIQTWTPWLSRGALHVAKASDDGDFLVVGGGYLLDNELHIYRWNPLERSYIKVWEAGSGIFTRDILDVAFGDSDNNLLIEIAAASADGRVYLFEQAHISDPIANLENRFDFVWKSPERYFQVPAVEFHDADLDGDQDLIIGGWDNKIHIFEYTAHSNYPFSVEHWITLTEKWNSSELDDKIQSLEVGDFNNNGLPDIIVGTISGSVYIFENDGVVLAPHGIEFPFPNDDNYRQIWNNSGSLQPIWHPIGQIATGELDANEGTDAVLLAWGQGAWVLRYSKERDFYLEQLTQNFEGWQMQGAYPLENFADWMVRDPDLNWQVYYQHGNGTKYPEPWDLAAQNAFDIFANSAVTGEPAHSTHGGVLFNGNEYKLITTATTWTNAKAVCESLGGHLVTISSPEENDFVSNLAKSNLIWLGFTDSETYGASEGNWRWITGEIVTYTNWKVGEPNNLNDEDYAHMYSDGFWNDADPGSNRFYICEWENHWEDYSALYNGHEYKFIPTATDWSSAKAACEALDGHLVTITSAEENAFIHNLVGNNRVWLGFTDSETYGASEGNWRWITGENVSYTNWHYLNPSNSGGIEHYAELMGNYGGLWNDLPLSHAVITGYVCEWDSLVTPHTTFYTNATQQIRYETPSKAPHNGTIFNYHEYKLIQTLVNWTTAQAACEALGGHLVTINSSEENDFVTNLVGTDRVHIGFTDSPIYGASEGNFKWITNEIVNYDNWYAGEPDGGLNANYSELMGDQAGQWADLSDTQLRYYVVEWDGLYGGSFFNFHEYRLIPSAVNWTTAKATCESLGGYLVTITSSEENDFVTRLVGNDRVFIGLTDDPAFGATEGSFQWITNETFSFSNWSTGEPSGNPEENYVELLGNLGGTWMDLEGTDLRYFVVEIPYNKTILTPFANATGTWNLGKGEELASNGNEDPDLYIIFDPTANPDPSEWNISLSNNLINWYQINTSSINPLTNGKGLAIDVDPLFASKKLISAQYIQLTLNQLNATNPKERRVNAIFFPHVARPLTIAVSVTVSPLTFEYNEPNPPNKIVFGGSDGRLLAFQYQPHNISYYKKFKLKPAELTEIPATDYGIINPTFNQIWDSFVDDFWNLGEAIWSIQETPKKTFIPSWRYIDGETKEFSHPTSNNLLDLHHMSIFDNPLGDLEIAVTRRSSPLVFTYDYETGIEYTANEFVNVNGAFPSKILTQAFGDLYQDINNYDDLIVFPWYDAYPFTKPSTYDSTLLPVIWEWGGSAFVNPITLTDVDNHLFAFLFESTTYPSATIIDMNNDSLQDVIISNGRLAILWNIGDASTPEFKFDFKYFEDFNNLAPPNPIFSPNAWDYDQDKDYDIAYSYGPDSAGEIRYGMDFFENQGTLTEPLWVRNAYVMKNPTTDGSLRFNNYTAGVIIPSNSNESSADSLWVWNDFEDGHLRNLIAETDKQSSFILGTNPELLKLELNLRQTPPDSINFGYSILKSWTNLEELEDWTLTLTTSLYLDGDNNSEIIVSDYDNNIYVFEHLTENTYKRAFRSHDLNHTEETDYSPYKFQELEGIPGEFKKTIYDHGNLLAAGLDYDEDGNEEFLITAALSLYVFEATGFNDEFKLIYEKDHQSLINDTSITQFSALGLTPDFDSRGAMIALAAKNKLFLIRYDPQIGWLESFQPISNLGFDGVPGNPSSHPGLSIRTILFADLNQDGNTELWLGGQNTSGVIDSGFLLALDSNYGDIHQIYDFPAISTTVNALETADADYDGNLELIIGHGHGIDVFEANGSSSDLQFNLQTFISSDPNYHQDLNITSVFGTYQSPNGLAPRSNEIFLLENGNYFSIYGLEETSHDPYANYETNVALLQNLTNNEGRLFYSISSDPTNLGTIKDTSLNLTGNLPSISDGYEFRPTIIQNPQSGVITVGYLANYNSTNIFNRTVNLRQFDASGIPLMSPLLVDNIVNTLGSTGDPDYYVSYEDLALIHVSNDLIMVAYVVNDIIKPDVSGYNGNVSVELINTTDWTSTDISSFIGIEANYSINSIELIELNGQIAIIFGGHARGSYKTNSQIYLTLLNSTYHNQGYLTILEGEGHYQFPDIYQQPSNLNYISIVCEHIFGGVSEVIYTFSIDAGNSWSNQYTLITDDPYLQQYEIISGTYSLMTIGGAEVSNRRIFRPRITADNTGGVYYQFLTSFLIPQGSDPSYSGNIVNFLGSNYHLVTQLWVGLLESGSWFRYNDVTNVRALTVGDSDSDLRSEIFISHDTRVTLFEVSQESQGQIFYSQEWQYEPPAFLSANPEQVNSSYVRYLVDESLKKRETGAVAIADANGNGWPELIFSVRGGDVFTFELLDQDQPLNERYFITETKIEKQPTFPINDTNLLITEVMYDPSDSDAKWLEIYNPTAIPIDLTTWEVFGKLIYINLTGTIQPNDYHVIAKNNAVFSTYYSTSPDYIFNGLNFDITGDTVTLRNVGVSVDSISWGSDAVGYSLSAQNTTIRRLSLHDTDSGSDWEDSGTFGVPGDDPYYLSPLDIADSMLIDINDDNNLDLVLCDFTYGKGIIAWDLITNKSIWHQHYAGNLEKLYFLNDSSTEIIVGISVNGIIGISLNGIKLYNNSVSQVNISTSHLFTDIDNDNKTDLIIASYSDIRAINSFNGDEIWKVSVDNDSKGYFDISAYQIDNQTTIAVSSSDFETYRQINVLQNNGSLLKSFVLTGSQVDENLTSLTKFDSNSRSLLDDFDGDGQLDILLAIIDNYNQSDPLSRIEIWNIENLDPILNLTLPVNSDVLNFDNFDVLSHDVNNDSLPDIIIPIPQFSPRGNIPANGFSSGIFALDIASKASILWERYFTESLLKFKRTAISFIDNEVVLAYCNNSGIFSLSLTGSDVFWVSGSNESGSVNIGFENNVTKIGVSYDNGSYILSEVIGKLSPTKNYITIEPTLVKTTVSVIYDVSISSFTIPVFVSNDGTEKLLIAFTNGTLILRTLEKEIWRVNIAAFSRISATGLILNKEAMTYGLAIKTDNSNLLILDKTSTTVVRNKPTNTENISVVNLGEMSDFLLMQSVVGNQGIFSLYSPQSNLFVWNYTNPTYFTSWDVVCLDSSISGIHTHIIGLDYLGNAYLIELPTARFPGGVLPSPTSGKWIFIESFENDEQLADIFLYSNNSQLVHYKWVSTNTQVVRTYYLPQMSILSWDIINEGTITKFLFATKDEGVIIYQENSTGMSLLGKETNYYIGSSDHQFANFDNVGEHELLLIVGNSLVIKELINNTVIELHSFVSFISSMKTWQVDTSKKPVMITILEDRTIAVADPMGRLIVSGSAAEVSDLIFEPFSPEESKVSKQNRIEIPILPMSSILLIATILISTVVFRRKQGKDPKEVVK